MRWAASLANWFKPGVPLGGLLEAGLPGRLAVEGLFWFQRSSSSQPSYRRARRLEEPTEVPLLDVGLEPPVRDDLRLGGSSEDQVSGDQGVVELAGTSLRTCRPSAARPASNNGRYVTLSGTRSVAALGACGSLGLREAPDFESESPCTTRIGYETRN